MARMCRACPLVRVCGRGAAANALLDDPTALAVAHGRGCDGHARVDWRRLRVIQSGRAHKLLLLQHQQQER